jgi:hypothetical protein
MIFPMCNAKCVPKVNDILKGCKISFQQQGKREWRIRHSRRDVGVFIFAFSHWLIATTSISSPLNDLVMRNKQDIKFKDSIIQRFKGFRRE